ncbi:MAG: helix-turn-helix domain-containing protein [Myxococcota bacterium]
MAQVLKEEVRQRILDAGLEVFAREGYASATMAHIARAAGLSTGNIYRYFATKEALFAAVLPDSFVAGFTHVVRGRALAARGLADVGAIAGSDAHQAVTQALVDLVTTHRLRVVILLGRAEGTPHAGYAEELVGTMVRLALAHARELVPGLEVGDGLRFDLRLVYRNLLGSLVAVLVHYRDPGRIAAALARYSRYHLAGLEALFRGGGSPSDG